MKNPLKIGLGMMIVMLGIAMPAYAQVDLGLDVNSRYVWRGTDFGNSPSFQPQISYSAGNFTVGGWAAFASNGNPAGSEIDLFASYSLETGIGNFDLMITDYTFPESPTGNYFTSEAHFVELGLAYSGTENLPLTLFTGVFVTNDDDYSVYAELGYSISNIELSLGMTPSASAMYGTTGAGIVSAGLGTSREIVLTEMFSLTLNGSFLINPYQENAFFLVGFSL